MPPRLATRRERDNDFSAVGKIGRRTGVTLPQGRLDENGIEEITGIFSSPRKPSPIRRNVRAVSGSNENSTELTPTEVLSMRKSLRGASQPPPRSVSPKKTGINGIARRSNGVDVLSPVKTMAMVDLEDRENTPVLTPPRPMQNAVRRFSPSPEKSPLREISANGVTPNKSMKGKGRAQDPGPGSAIDRELAEMSDIDEYEKTVDEIEQAVNASLQNEGSYINFEFPDQASDGVNVNGIAEDRTDDLRLPGNEDDADDDFEPGQEEEIAEATPPAMSIRGERKRKSASIEEGESSGRSASVAPQQSKKARTSKQKENKSTIIRGKSPTVSRDSREESSSTAQEKPKTKAGRQPGKVKDPNIPMSIQQKAKLDQIIEKVAARPGKQKSLYILRRETPLDESATHTRSGRVSVKPLAYWRNERCVYGGSPGGTTEIKNGARFPLNSIKEIIRTEEVQPARQGSKAKTSKGIGKGEKRRRTNRATLDDDDASVSDASSISDCDGADPDAEPWESEVGIFRGPVHDWDQDSQLPMNTTEEVDIAYAPSSIPTQKVIGSTFRYAKLLRSSFFGSGIVELPPGGTKRPKNSKKMHMSFFVAKGRVTVSVGGDPGNGGADGSTFSVGKGGFWQVPRGNQYSIENELDKTAKIFFSQACEPVPEFDEEERDDVDGAEEPMRQLALTPPATFG